MSILKLFSPSDPELVEKTLSRLAEQDTWNDVFSTKLIELLDKLDQIKHEIRERMRKADERIRKAESVVQAESLLLDEAAKAEELKNKLATTERALNAVHSEFLAAKIQYQGAENVRAQSQKMIAEAEDRFSSARALLDSASNRCQNAIDLATSATKASQRSSEKLEESSRVYVDANRCLETAKSGFEKAAHNLEIAESAQQQASVSAANARIESEKATIALDSARRMAADAQDLAENANRRFHSAQEMQLKAARLARISARSAALAVALSWVAMTWTGWLMDRTRSLFWTAFILSVLIVAAGIFVMKGVESDS